MFKVFIELGAPGAQRVAARGDVAVIIDAIRASVTITSALVAGAAKVIPVLTVEEARAFLGRAGYLVAGERGGARLEGFHFGNSPTELLSQSSELKGKTLILTTTNGTRCVHAARLGAAALLVGSLPNATAVTQAAFALAQERGRDITLVAAGLNDEVNVEDLFTARLLARQLGAMGAVPIDLDLEPSTEDSITLFASSEAGQRVSDLGYGDDVALCARLDVFNVVPIYDANGEGGFVALSPGCLKGDE